MRLYNKKNIRNLVDSRSRKRQEIRDAILWEVDHKECRVKIQGSNSLVVAHYPRNQRENPTWLKPGNAVKVVHRDGIRGYVEVIGEGRTIPTPSFGGGTTPAIGVVSDGIISGLRVTVRNELCFWVSAGTYRYNGVVYISSGTNKEHYTMGSSMTMGASPVVVMGDVLEPVCVDPAVLDDYARFDIIYIDKTSGKISVQVGIHAKVVHYGCDGPELPPLPYDAIQLATVLLVGNNKDMEDTDINRVWEDPYFSHFKWVEGEGYVGEITDPWSPGDPPPTMYDAMVISNAYSQYDLPLYGEIELAIGSSYGDVWATEQVGSILFNHKSGTDAYHPRSGMVIQQVRITMFEDPVHPTKILIQDIRLGDWIPEVVPIYSIITKVGLRKTPRLLNDEGGLIEDGSYTGNYEELISWVGVDPYPPGDPLDYGGDLEDLGNIWKI